MKPGMCVHAFKAIHAMSSSKTGMGEDTLIEVERCERCGLTMIDIDSKEPITRVFITRDGYVNGFERGAQCRRTK